MRKHYDLDKMKLKKNPFAKQMKKPVHIRIDNDVIDYFKSMSNEFGVPYQTVINIYLRDCLKNKRKIRFD